MKLMPPIVFSLLVLALSIHAAPNAPETFQNPVIPGFHPDPSVCRVGEDYYLVNSSFEWFPGLPIYHSKDLVNWELIGHGIHRPGQADLPEGLGDSRGMYAPTLRYHEGLFYLICTNVNAGGNFYVTAKDPAGPWSDAVWLHSRGIDPSLYWENGKCYYTGHANITGVNDWPNKNGVWMQELDLEQQTLVGERVQLTHGHAKNARWTEGPHLYKINGKYMLLVAEGGTGFHHGVTVHHSDELWGPYIPDHSNPVLTHRHLGQSFPIHSVGHADLVQTQKGDWWSVMLGKRLDPEGNTFLARETFLTPVVFEEQTPVFNPGVGNLLMEQKRPELPWSPVQEIPSIDEFEDSKLDLYWSFLRTPMSEWYDLVEGSLVLHLRPEAAHKLENPSLIARRIEHHKFEATTHVNFQTDEKTEQAGLIVYRNSQHFYMLVKEMERIVLYAADESVPTVVAELPYRDEAIEFKVVAKDSQLTFQYAKESGVFESIGDPLLVSNLSDEKAGGFNGPFIGMYATSNGLDSKNKASFDWFEYIGMQ